MNKRVLQISFLCLLGFVIGTGGAWYLETSGSNDGGSLNRIEPAAGQNLAGAPVGGSFSLTDHNGKAVTDADYKDSYKLVFFGFTSCPMICPTELKKISMVLEALGPKAENVKPLFISVDPERDTPDVLREYVGLFHSSLIGLTGTAEQIKAVTDAYKVYAAKVNDPELTEYTMDHSAYTFLMAPDGTLVALFGTSDSAADMTREILTAI